jgi:hypothetical protein
MSDPDVVAARMADSTLRDYYSPQGDAKHDEDSAGPVPLERQGSFLSEALKDPVIAAARSDPVLRDFHLGSEGDESDAIDPSTAAQKKSVGKSLKRQGSSLREALRDEVTQAAIADPTLRDYHIGGDGALGDSTTVITEDGVGKKKSRMRKLSLSKSKKAGSIGRQSSFRDMLQ